MKYKINILLLLLAVNFSNCSAQKTISKNSDNTVLELKKEVEELSSVDQNLQNQITTSLSINQVSNGCIANKLDTMNLMLTLFALLLTVGGIFLGVYINRKEKAINAAILKGEENLATQLKIQDDIKNNVANIYTKIKREEFNEIIKSIELKPEEIHNHFSNLLSLKLTSTDYDILSTKLRVWHENSLDFGIMYDLFNILYIKFPGEIHKDSRISNLILQYWMYLSRRIPYNSAIQTLSHFVSKFIKNNDPSSRIELKEILKGISGNFNSSIVATEIFNEITKDKNERFKLHDIIRGENIFPLYVDYSNLMKSEYENNAENTEEQNQIISNIQ